LDKSTFNRINSFCDNNNTSQTERDFVIRKFLESLLNALETKERQKGSSLTDQEIKDIQDALLNDITLESLVVSGRSYFSTLEERFFLQFQKNNKNNNFWQAVGTNIAANVLYSIFLIIMFVVAKDQISSWIDSLYK